MANPVLPGRFTAQTDEPFVVFIIGMRVNKLWAIRKWWPVFQAMGPMLQTLYQHPQKGFLGMQTSAIWRGVLMVQYWRSFEDLENFARNQDDPHLEPWRRYNKAIGKDGTVGVYHETYIVQPGQYEAVYANMPVFGLAAATRSVPVDNALRKTARGRLKGVEIDEVVAAQ